MKLKIIISVFIVLTSISYSQVDFQTQIQPIFNNNCTGCHGTNSGVTLTSYSTTMNSTGNQYGTLIVNPFNAVASPLYDKVRLDKTPDHGSRMPQGGALIQDQVDLIKNWINEGAHEALVNNVAELRQPERFRLLTNYPNPFNPTTNFSFETSNLATVELTVFDLLGNQVLQIGGNYNKGQHILSLDMHEQPSGVYYYTLSVIEPTEIIQQLIGKMTLLK
ncbi:MAG: T9SS type A sorting domain-containing protein [Candidatus Marinimicrobia bacterium]|nr:T9SS type A sorting domain-containing protein [Candidatus Neomarinimicrobiota bacterium]